MKKTFKNEEALDCVILASKLDEKGKLGYAIAKNTRKLKEEIKEYIAKRDELLKKYGTPVDGRKGDYTIDRKNRTLYDAELEEYENIEFEVELMQVSESDFVNSTLTSRQMEMLLWMIEELEKKGE